MTTIFIAVSCVLTGILVVFAVRLQRSLKEFSPQASCELPKELPTVSVCIPARNEMHAMTQCLERVLASDYPKLEILVFDDSSADDTSVLVRSFAHAGVRFVPGTELPKGWLGKNHALSVLAQEASGSYALFMDVDCKIAPGTISQMMRCTVQGKYDMVSVIPQRSDVQRASTLFGSLRYFWQLVAYRRALPASSGALWMIHRKTLFSELRGFGMYRGSVQPEAHIAAALGSAYRCLLSTPQLGVTFEKKWSSQMETARRLLYPMAGGTPFGGAVALAGLMLLNVPHFALLSSLIFGWTEIQVMGLWLTLVFAALYSEYASRLWRGRWWLGGLLWPVVVFQELLVFIWSIWGYANGTITWKGRPVRASVLHADSIKIDR